VEKRTRPVLAWISRKGVPNLVYDFSLQRRIALRCMAVLSSTGFSLCTVNGPQFKPHRLKPVLLDRAGPALSLLAVNPAGNIHRVEARNADTFLILWVESLGGGSDSDQKISQCLGRDAGLLYVSRAEPWLVRSDWGRFENHPAAAQKDAGDCQDRGH
jgi:hypothetical protein